MAAQQDVVMECPEVWRLSARQLGERFASGELTPSAVLESLLVRIERLNPALNAIVSLNEQAVAEARASTRRWAEGRALGLLDGVPLTLKDNLVVKGMPATWGSRLFRDYVPEQDELPVARLRQAGMVFVGKTNVPEFTLEGYTDNPLFGVTRNPWDLRLTPGGSSGGAVSSVAAGLTPVAIGTDGGGSIRRPASHAGLVGLKPSIGRIPRLDGLPQILLDFEVVGPITRTVSDAALVFDAMAGADARDRHSLGVDGVRNAGRELPESLRILYVPHFGNNPLDAEIASSVRRAADRLQALGHQVVEGELPFSLAFINEFWPNIGAVGLAALFQRYPQATEVAADKFVALAKRGAEVSAADYFTALGRIKAFRREVTEAFADIDIIMTPSAAALPWPAAEVYPPEIAGQAVGPRGHAVYTGWVNACGHPAINLPAEPSCAGLPIGFQLVGAFGADDLLLRLAAQYEKAGQDAWGWPAFAHG